MERDRDRDRKRERERELERQRQGLWLAFGDFTAADPLPVQLLQWKKHLRGLLYLFDPCVSGGTGVMVRVRRVRALRWTSTTTTLQGE